MTRARGSLRRRLTLAVAAVVGLSLCVFSLFLHAAFGQALWRQFDERLAEDARVVASMVEEREQGPWEFEYAGLEEFERKREATYFEVWMDDGSVLARSPSLGQADLRWEPHAGAPVVALVTLPDGRPGRSFQASLLPSRGEDGPANPSGRRVAVVVAFATGDIDEVLVTLWLLLLGFGLSTMALAALAGTFAVRGSLKPIGRLTKRVDAIDARRLGERLPIEDLPSELHPAVAKLNELLGRLEEAFARERQFSADTSHELRTPLSGLRSILEVGLSRDRSAPEYRTAIQDSLAIVLHLNALIENLLLLARLDARQVTASSDRILLHALVEDCLLPLEAKARERGLSIENQVTVEAEIISDYAKMRSVVGNLISNAVEYTAEHGRVVVSSDPPRGNLLEVFDSGPPIPEDALERVFDRFFRLESSRSGTGVHAGIGLALVRALCDRMGFRVKAENTAGGGVTFKVLVDGSAGAGAPPDRRPV